MRSSLIIAAIAPFVSFAIGCVHPVDHPVVHASVASVNQKTFVMHSAGVALLKLTTAPGDTCTAGDGSLLFNPGHPLEIEFWLVRDAQTVDDAVGKVGSVIVSEFRDFKPAQTTATTVAGAPAKHLVGSGHEADDNDPGQADVVVFQVGSHIFVACNHGESLDSPTQQHMAEMLNTAAQP